MAPVISFGWTAPALLARRKSVTRREWEEGYARNFHAGDIVRAYDHSPRAAGKQIATIRLTHDPYLELSCCIPDDDWEREGFAYLSQQGLLVNGLSPETFWQQWKTEPTPLYVIRFEVVSIP
jgi:hypothetical protein